MPALRSKMQGDDVATWVECPGCRRTGAPAIDSARNDGAAVRNWNNGKGRQW